MNNELIFNNANIVLANEVFQGSLSVKAGRIKSFDHTTSRKKEAIDVQGDYLIPGLVELHTDNLERHLMPRPKTYWPELPALQMHDFEIVAAGITTVFDSVGVGEFDPSSLRGKGWQSLINAFNYSLEQRTFRSDHYFHVRCELPTPNTMELFKPFENHPRLKLLSLMDHTPGQRQFEDINQAKIYNMGKKGWTEEKFNQRVAEGALLQERYAKPNRDYFLNYGKARGVPIASHDDTTAAHVQEAAADGLVISEFPTRLSSAQMARDHGMWTIFGAPNMVRGGSHSGNVASVEAARARCLDILSSDYVPGSLLQAAFLLIEQAAFTLPQAVACVTKTPAQAVGMLDRGEIKPGLVADLVWVRVQTNHLGEKSPFVRAVWREGMRVV